MGASLHRGPGDNRLKTYDRNELRMPSILRMLSPELRRFWWGFSYIRFILELRYVDGNDDVREWYMAPFYLLSTHILAQHGAMSCAVRATSDDIRESFDDDLSDLRRKQVYAKRREASGVAVRSLRTYTAAEGAKSSVALYALVSIVSPIVD